MSEERDDHAPVTAASLTQVFTSFEARLNAKLDQHLSALRSEMIERIEGSETKLLKEFRKCGSD